MRDEKDWLHAKEAKELTGHSTSIAFLHFAQGKKIQYRASKKRKGWREYHKPDITRAIGERSEQHITSGKLNQIPLRRFDTFPKLRGDWLVIADAHCPFVDWEFFDQAVRIKDRMKVGNLILGGDTLDCAALSRFPKLFRVSWQTEKNEAKKFLTACAKEFDNVVCLTANHEMRYLLKLWVTYEDDLLESGRTDVWEVATANMEKALKKKIRFTIYPYCTINNSWRVTHPVSARKIPLSLARELSALYAQNIIVTHAHMSAWAYAPNTNHQIFDCGVFADPIHFDYKNLRVTAHGQWSESFIAIKDNDGYLFRKGDKMPVVI